MNTIHHTNGQHSEQHIRERAYALWERAGSPPNRELEFWLQAEDELVGPEHLKALIASAIGDPVLPVPKPTKSASNQAVPRKTQAQRPSTSIRPTKSVTSRSTSKTSSTRAKRGDA